MGLGPAPEHQGWPRVWLRGGYGWCAPGSRQNTLIMASQAEPAAKVLAVADRRHGSGASALGTPSTSSGASSSELPPPDGELSDASGSSDDESESGSEMFSDEETGTKKTPTGSRAMTRQLA